MANDSLGKQPRAVRFLFENSIFLIAGAIVALVWANTHHKSYEHLVHFNLARLFTEHVGEHGFTVHHLINDVMMALFFALAGKEVWESFLPGGALSSVKKAATPLLATLGGIVGPAFVYLAIVQSTGQWADLA
ncbi:MAG: Na+/H+ antiporter NhaA, partial [Pirellulaceae bacterium]